jgi:hypothetical protein
MGSQIPFEGQNRKAPLGHRQELKQLEECKNYIEGSLSHDLLAGRKIGLELSSEFHSISQKVDRSQQLSR